MSTNVQALLYWPTPTIPPPPEGFEPEYMDAPNKDVLASQLRKKFDTGNPVLTHRKTYAVIEYVMQYSARPSYVRGRALDQLSETHDVHAPDFNDKYRALMAQMDKDDGKRVKAHQQLLERGYRYGSKSTPATPDTSDPIEHARDSLQQHGSELQVVKSAMGISLICDQPQTVIELMTSMRKAGINPSRVRMPEGEQRGLIVIGPNEAKLVEAMLPPSAQVVQR